MASHEPPSSPRGAASERSSFIGRASELAAIGAHFARGAPLVTVTGAGGTGKTRLALRYASLRAAEYPGGTWFADLSSARAPLDIAREMGRALGVPLPAAGGEEATALHLGQAVNGLGAALLVLDNVEQVVGAAAELLDRWVGLAPEATFLVTSRERLRMLGEVVLALEPLAVPARGAEAEVILDSEAARLFLDRARASGALVAVTGAQAEILGEVVRRLEGLPLAIELCAPRTRMLGLGSLLSVLSSLLEAASSGHRGSGARTATLRGAIDWSWSLLDAEEQDALARCSVFRGGFDLGAAAAVFDPGAAPERGALDLLQALHDKSLLRVTAPEASPEDHRFSLLESVREYAAERLRERGATADAEERHARWYVAIGARLRADVDGPAGAEALRRLTLESENLLAVPERTSSPAAAVGALLALEPVFDARGPLARYADALAGALRRGPVDPALEARARLSLGLASTRSGRTGEGARELEEAAALGSRHAVPEVAATAYGNLGVFRVRAGALEAARAAFLSARRQAEAAGLERVRADVDNLEASYLSLVGQNDASLALHERALAACRRLGFERGEAFTRSAIGGRYVEYGVLGAARAHLAAAQAIYDRYGAVRELAYVHHSLGTVSLEEGDHAAARAHLREAIAAARQAGVPLREANGLLWLGHLELLTGHVEEARRLYADAVVAFGDTFARGRGAAFAADGAAAARLDRVAEAALLFDRAEPILARPAHPADLQMLSLLRAHLDLSAARDADRRGDPERAARLRAEVDARIEEARRAGADGSDDTRFALATLRVAAAAPAAPESPATWVFSADLRRFRGPTGGPVSLARRRTLGNLLAALLRARLDAPGAALPAAALLEAGWPEQDIGHERGSNRLRVAMWTLRDLGLRGILASRGDGYFLDPAVRIDLEAADAATF